MGKDNPRIYAYTLDHESHKGWIKVGETRRTAEERVKEQHQSTRKGKELTKIILNESRARDDGSVFTDRDVHKHLVNKGFRKDGEWIKCTLEQVEAAIIAVKYNITNEDNRTKDFKMRPEQKDAVRITANYFRILEENNAKDRKFLWNAKMRFGKTFATYQLAKEMGWKNILILTFKPAAEDAWKHEGTRHIDFSGWQYISKKSELKEEELNHKKPIICFGSFQDYLGTDGNNEIKPENKWVHDKKWDCIIIDEYHFGAWREKAKELTEDDSGVDLETDYDEDKIGEVDESDVSLIKANHFLYLSGTPFRAIASGEFPEGNVYNWSYVDEQKAKRYFAKDPNSPYKYLPKMHLLTYKLPENIRKIATDTDFDEFDLNKFFKVKGGKFINEEDVRKWLKLIKQDQPVTKESAVDELKRKRDNPNINKYKGKSYAEILNGLSHALWFLPSVASCVAMKELLEQESLYTEYEIVLVAGKAGGLGAKAKIPVDEAMHKDGKNPSQTKTIILTCGKLTTGVTLEPLSAVFMLRNLTSPETYFQAAFRAQNEWIEKDNSGEIKSSKQECYIVDFAPNRALKQVVDYVEKTVNNDASKTDSKYQALEEELDELKNFLPIISYEGGCLDELNVEGIIQIANRGTTTQFLARSWRGKDFMSSNKKIFDKIIADPEALQVIFKMKSEDRKDKNIDIIIAETEEIKNTKNKSNKKPNTSSSRKAKENEEKKMREVIEQKISKFISRIPAFMYLTDYREAGFKDIIRNFDDNLFKKVTGISKAELKMLTDYELFNEEKMNEAIEKFKAYEDKSFNYLGKDADINE